MEGGPLDRFRWHQSDVERLIWRTRTRNMIRALSDGHCPSASGWARCHLEPWVCKNHDRDVSHPVLHAHCFSSNVRDLFLQVLTLPRGDTLKQNAQSSSLRKLDASSLGSRFMATRRDTGARMREIASNYHGTASH